MIDGWTCPECATANRASSVVCANCGHVRPDLDRTQAYATEPSPQAAIEPDRTEDDAAVIAAGGIPGWNPTGPTTPPPTGPPTPDPMASEPASYATPTETADASSGSPGWAAPPTAQLADPSAIPGWSTAAPEPTPLWRRIPLVWLVVGGFVLVGVIGGWYFNASRSATGEITKSGDLHALDLRIGDCFDIKDASADTIDNVRAVPCTSEHQYELFFAGSMPSGDYPSDAAFEGYVTDNCGSAFASYVGKAFDDSALDVYWLEPTDDAWRSGDRSVQCAVYDPNRDRLTQSLKGAQQ